MKKPLTTPPPAPAVRREKDGNFLERVVCFFRGHDIQTFQSPERHPLYPGESFNYRMCTRCGEGFGMGYLKLISPTYPPPPSKPMSPEEKYSRILHRYNNAFDQKIASERDLKRLGSELKEMERNMPQHNLRSLYGNYKPDWPDGNGSNKK